MTRTKALLGATCCLITIVIGVAALPAKRAKSQNVIAPKEFEEQLAALLKQASGQRRASLTHNEILARVARERAQDMARRNYFGHVNPDGLGPDYLVSQAGYLLPKSYGKKKSSNNIETIASGNTTPEDVWAAWMGSSAHRKHLLGLTFTSHMPNRRIMALDMLTFRKASGSIIGWLLSPSEKSRKSRRSKRAFTLAAPRGISWIISD